MQVALAHERNLVVELQVLGGYGRREATHGLDVTALVVVRDARRLGNRHPLGQACQLVQGGDVVRHTFVQGRHFRQQRGRVPLGQILQQTYRVLLVDGAQHGPHVGVAQPALAVGRSLVEQRERVAHAAVRGPREQLQGAGLRLDLLGIRDFREPRLDEADRQPLEVELEAA